MLLGAIQCIDARRVVDIAALALRAAGFDKAISVVGDVALADLPAQIDQRLLALTFIQQKEHIDPIQRFHRLHGDVVRIAGANADDQQLFHQNSSSRAMPGKRSRQMPLKRKSIIASGSMSIAWNAAPCSTCISAARMTNG